MATLPITDLLAELGDSRVASRPTLALQLDHFPASTSRLGQSTPGRSRSDNRSVPVGQFMTNLVYRDGRDLGKRRVPFHPRLTDSGRTGFGEALQSERSKSFGAMGMRSDWLNKASGSFVSMRSRPSRFWSVNPSPGRSPA